MRATDGLQTTINLGPVHRDDQALSLQLSLGMSLPVPSQDEHLPDQIEAFVHQASEFRVLAFLGGDEVGIISSYLTSS